MSPSASPRIAILGVGYDGSSSYLRGTAGAPPVIREALWSEAGNPWTELGIDLSTAALDDEGDLPLTGNEDPVQIWRAIEAGVSILHFDAHGDLWDEFQGDRYSHACPFARIMEEGLTDRLVQVGIRTMNGHQRAQAKRFGVEVIEMKVASRCARRSR